MSDKNTSNSRRRFLQLGSLIGASSILGLSLIHI